jgi:hypothetical protein
MTLKSAALLPETEGLSGEVHAMKGMKKSLLQIHRFPRLLLKSIKV